MEAWITCPRCGFSQIPSGQCLRCQAALDTPTEPPAPTATPRPARRPPDPAVPLPSRPEVSRRPRLPIYAAAAAAGLLLLAALYWGFRPRSAQESLAPGLEPPSAAGALDLTGRWQDEIPITLGNPPRPALKAAFLETDTAGEIMAAGVLLTDPGQGGAGGGYRIVRDARARLESIQALLSGSKGPTALPMEFVPYPPWVPKRDRVWRVLEGRATRPGQARYLLLESVEDDFLVQAGVNETGFLSWVFFSRPYASDRGPDALSRAIHPAQGSALRSFRDLVWDLSGSADFLTLVVNATVTGPDGTRVRLTLKR